MKLLFIGPLHDMSGFASASRNFLRTLLQCPMDVVARKITYDKLDVGQKFKPEDWLKDAQSKDLQGVDMCIQMTTANIEATPVPNIVNGLYTFLETDRIQKSWTDKCNEFDFLMVPCRANAEAMLRSGVQRPIIVCAVPCDASEFNRPYTPYDIKNSAGRTIFYNICQLSQKKGVDALLRAYYAAFWDRPDEVLLVLKTYINMQNRQNDLDAIKKYITDIRTACRIPVERHPPVLPLVFTMTNEEIHELHIRGDCYVNSSRAEGFCIPLFDAMSHGKAVISNNCGGMADFVKHENSLLYSAIPTFFFNMQHPDPGLFTGIEQCYDPCIPEMSLLMRRYHLLKTGNDKGDLNEENKKEWESVQSRQFNASLLKNNLDYKNVALKLWPQIEIIYNSWKTTGKVNFNESPKENTEVLA